MPLFNGLKVHALDSVLFETSPSLAVAAWAVAELKEVHAGKANIHIHTALDVLLLGMTTRAHIQVGGLPA
jgi:hypothetical protein